MKKVFAFCKKETVFVLSLLAALATMALTPPSPAYFGYVDWAVLALLLCLMAVVAGLRKAGVLDALAWQLLRRAGTAGRLTAVLTALCFFAAMLLTNDVALLTFVPLTLFLIPEKHSARRIYTVVLETVAANLGSLATPVGNPQNLFLYRYYEIDTGAFFRLTLPLTLLSLALVAMLCALTPGRRAVVEAAITAVPLEKSAAIGYGLLFLLCLLSVFHLLPIWLCLLVVLAWALLRERSLLKEVDWMLLATFLCFFVFVGNLSALPAVSSLLQRVMEGRTLLVGAAASQIISNVPAAVLLAPFTEDVGSLLLGVNIGGLGTPVASLASLISYRLYCAAPRPRRGRYLLVFSAVNFALLLLLLLGYGAFAKG